MGVFLGRSYLQPCAGCGEPLRVYQCRPERQWHSRECRYGRPIDRWNRKVERSNGCWLWTGSTNRPDGYGSFYFEGHLIGAHRFAYEHFVGPIPLDTSNNALDVLHHCDNRLCVNPAHLFVGDALANLRDMVTKGRSKQGERHHAAKLTDEQVALIRNSTEPQRILAARLGVSQQTISDVKHHKVWRHIPS